MTLICSKNIFNILLQIMVITASKENSAKLFDAEKLDAQEGREGGREEVEQVACPLHLVYN